jgi:hypothetical protein
VGHFDAGSNLSCDDAYSLNVLWISPTVITYNRTTDCTTSLQGLQETPHPHRYLLKESKIIDYIRGMNLAFLPAAFIFQLK